MVLSALGRGGVIVRGPSEVNKAALAGFWLGLAIVLGHDKAMSTQDLAVVVLAAGMGTRMRSALPKVLHPLAGRPMINHVLATVEALDAARTVVVIGPDRDDVAEVVSPHTTVVQADRLGTGHAVQQAEAVLKDFTGDVLVMYGDTPLISLETIAAMRAVRQGESKLVVLGFEPAEPGAYGRLITGPEGLERIVEAKDATAEELAVPVCNSGLILAESPLLFDFLGQVTNDNAKGEYYLTDVPALARSAGHRCDVVMGSEAELLGINSRVDLAAAEAVVQDDLRRKAMEGGATLVDPMSVYFSWDTALGQDVTIGPNTVFGPGVCVADNVTIHAHCHLEGAKVADGAEVGPYARLRPGAEIGPGAKIGNFVEVKKAIVEAGAKVNHLSYIGDARVGSGANIGAGTITANYNGVYKSQTDIGAGASTGSNSVLVAPVTIGDGAIIGAGAVIRSDVPANAIATSASNQTSKPDAADRYRRIKQAEKDKKG